MTILNLGVVLFALAASCNTLHGAKLDFLKKKDCMAFDQPPPTGRIWSLCEGHQFQAPTKAQKLQGIKGSNVMKCTAEMNFEQLCCFDYANLSQHLVRTGPMSLDIVQAGDNAADGSVSLAASSTSATAFLQNDALKEGKNAKQVTICTSGKPAPPAGAGETAAEMPIECIAHEFTVADIQNSASASPEDGNSVLNARIMYLKDQGIPLASVPVCTEVVQTCPCSGKPPASAAKALLDERANAGKGAVSLVADHEASVMSLMQKKGFFSALQTSGSFVMMQAGGFL